MYERSAYVVLVYQVSAHRSAAYAYRKRRGGSPCHRRLREVPSGCVPGHSVRGERRARVTAGGRSFVSIHTRSVVARYRRPDLYRGVGDASQPGIPTVGIGSGKGLTSVCGVQRRNWLKPGLWQHLQYPLSTTCAGRRSARPHTARVSVDVTGSHMACKRVSV